MSGIWNNPSTQDNTGSANVDRNNNRSNNSTEKRGLPGSASSDKEIQDSASNRNEQITLPSINSQSFAHVVSNTNNSSNNISDNNSDNKHNKNSNNNNNGATPASITATTPSIFPANSNNINKNNMPVLHSVQTHQSPMNNPSVSPARAARAANTSTTTATATTNNNIVESNRNNNVSQSHPQRNNSASAGFSVASFDNPLPSSNNNEVPPPVAPTVPQFQYIQPQPPVIQPPNIQQQQQQQSLPHQLIQSQQPQLQQQPQQQQSEEDPEYRPLNVKDALSYLEQVKVQFNSQPVIYNQFLDIMKDFKSQTIDTPGVIERVSTLFKGYPVLIQGFNTFLPQGYTIHCSDNPDDPVRVTTPMGTSTYTNLPNVDNTNVSPTLPTVQPLLQQPQPQGNNDTTNVINNAANQPQQVHAQTHLQEQTQAQTPADADAQAQAEVQAQVQAHAQAQAQAQAQMQAQNQNPEVEFSQAINYVNKIKTRYADQPFIYKHFLEILQTYQREEKPISEVYEQVTVLFNDAPDLLEDFKKFLPETPANNQPVQQPHAHPQLQQLQPRIPSISQQQQPSQLYPFSNNGPVPSGFYQIPQQNLPPIGSFSPPTATNANATTTPAAGTVVNNFRHGISMQTALPSMMTPDTEAIPISNLRSVDGFPPSSGGVIPMPNNQTADFQYQQQQPQPPLTNRLPDQFPLDQQQSQQQQAQQQAQQQQQQLISEAPTRPEIDLDPSIVPIIPEPTEPIENNITLVEETSFFEKVKKFISSKPIYMEFLKVLNLYSQDLLSTNELVTRVDYYIGSNKELFDWFKTFVGYSEIPSTIENIIHEKHKLDLDLCEAYGPSYKKLPKTDTFMPCSGRDAMCWEVLNDEWVGHPVWASEDSGFIAHRKNQYEETLFKIEEERHEYDFHIESNLRTIQTLETIANKINNMTAEEKKNFKLPVGLGHTSSTIYKKVIRKVYDKERGFEIIDALHEHPAFAVPIILRRLKEKDEEWRRAQREWNKVWRELEQKVYYKSLDHLGLTFKQADKKLLTTKQLISEISSIQVDQNNKRIHWLTPKPKSQLDFTFNDHDILVDILDLANVFIDHTSTYSNSEKERLKDFLRVFIGLFFSIPSSEIDKKLSGKNDEKFEKGSSSSSSTSNSTPSAKKRSLELDIPLADVLRKYKYQKIKEKVINELENNSNEYDERDEEFDEELKRQQQEQEEEDHMIDEEMKKPWLLGSVIDKTSEHGLIENRHIFNLFANTNIYVFFRHWTTIYERLLELKQINDKVTREINSRKVTPFAKDLGLISTQLTMMGLDFKTSDSYKELLNLTKRLIKNDIEHQWFEESLRQAYNNKAFKLYTADKVIQALVKHANSILTDSKASEIMALFEKDRLRSSTTTRDQIIYRLQTRTHMTNTENMFRIEFNENTNHVCIQYIAVEDLTLKPSPTTKETWEYYVTSYALPHPTEGVPQEGLKVPFLEKNLNLELENAQDLDNETEKNEFIEKISPEGISTSKLKIKIDQETYNLDVEPGSFDVFSRKSLNKFPTDAKKIESSIKEKSEAFNKFLSSKRGWNNQFKPDQVAGIEEGWKKFQETGEFIPIPKPITTESTTGVIAEPVIKPASNPIVVTPVTAAIEAVATAPIPTDSGALTDNSDHKGKDDQETEGKPTPIETSAITELQN
ncbi:transcriptional regulator SIN3 NDAI_0C02660 [Naumovozyma dairenensis CBS 421]|uniref:Histone deacetylase interacting domain-containing protein n=1 Tax=Naumovozyma dairenensis (strain ATCC 10597 / BCRC 20456 / CBS 421 / NBRC 0211 / NRRL Y-12639) TaxID=1071378 RepID=G0W815_NAUDC|nr:hypothetical protein NDAI_0C02660 [Naumovozyma dairenensis CBS 421]CCD23926.1 hypothetical protein NDAI_0C02660 [Naumovozyma dairenensis CBS 421]